jgi:hypothetical protein
MWLLLNSQRFTERLIPDPVAGKPIGKTDIIKGRKLS